MKRKTGTYITISHVGEVCQAFIPEPLPPQPDLHIDSRLRDLLDRTLLALGRLDSATSLLPETDLLLYMYIRKEAVLSSQIEGTQSSLSELLLFEMGGNPGASLDDVREVSSYVAALHHGLALLKQGLPLSLRLIREMHRVLLSQGRGGDKMPGEFRTSQNWIGGTRPGNATHVPCPPERLMECLGDWEKFLHNIPRQYPTLLKAALAHVQFETIHPFLDGNGRVGRLLITVLLCAEAILKEPLLYLSLYFKTHRNQYYDLLQQVRTHGDWESWVEFFLTAVTETAHKAVTTASELIKLAEEDRQKIAGVGRSAGSVLRVHQALLKRPIISIPKVCEITGLWTTSATGAIGHLEKLGLIREITGAKRNRLYKYSRYLDLLDEGTNPSGENKTDDMTKTQRQT